MYNLGYIYFPNAVGHICIKAERKFVTSPPWYDFSLRSKATCDTVRVLRLLRQGQVAQVPNVQTMGVSWLQNTMPLQDVFSTVYVNAIVPTQRPVTYDQR